MFGSPRSKRLSTLLPWGLVAALLAGGGFMYFDQAVSLDHATSQQKALERDLRLLFSLSIDLQGQLSRGQMLEMLRSRYASYIVKERGNDISVSGILLIFTGDRLVQIRSMSLAQ